MRKDRLEIIEAKATRYLARGFPSSVARHQASWEFGRLILRLRRTHTLRAIGSMLHLSPERIRVLETGAKQQHAESPIARYFALTLIPHKWE